MKSLLVMVLLVGAIVLSAQDQVERKDDHDALRALTKSATAALNKQDFDALANCFVKDFTFIPVDQTVVHGAKELKAYYHRVFNDDKYGLKSMKFTPSADVLTRFLGANVGYCYGVADNTYVLKSGRTVHMRSRWSANLVKKDGKWKIVMVHAGIDFLDNPLLSSVVATSKSVLMVMGTMVVLLILVVVYLLFKLKKAKTA